MRFLKRAALICLALYMGATGARIYLRKLYIWLPDYVLGGTREAPARKPVHLFFLYADHFEPGTQSEIIRFWESEYPKFAARHRDSAGRPPRQTWFYPGEQPIEEDLAMLQRLVTAGYGEVELHYHHSNDSEATARRKFQDAIDLFQRHGFLKTIDGATRFAFVHGNWGLDDSRGAEFCGVRTELRLLKELGCFADFTFPSLWLESQPSLVNQIYAATDDDRPKSYDRGVRLEAGRRAPGDLVIFEGPLVIAPAINPLKLFFNIEDGDIHPAVPANASRADLWVNANVHVAGRPDWVFVKVHGHPGSSLEAARETLGPHFDEALTHLEKRYNDGVNYVLHYVTAREAYNLARAAEANQQGDPAQYLNFEVKPYVAGRSRP